MSLSDGAWQTLAAAVPFGLGTWLLVSVVGHLKLQPWSGYAPLGRKDTLLCAAVGLILGLASSQGRWPAALVVLLWLLLILGLWLDAILFRVFTIELGPGGAAGVLPTTLFQELTGLAEGRQFLTQHPGFAALPLAAALAVYGILAHRPVATLLFFAWAVIVLRGVLAKGFATETLALAAYAVMALGRNLADPWPRTGTALGALALGALLVRSAPESRGTLGAFLFGRAKPPAPPLRPEHQWLTRTGPRAAAPSPAHGSCAGADVILLTVESLGRAHLGSGGASMPFLESVTREGVSSAAHFCVCPLTNEAHLALYASQYPPGDPAAPMQALRSAGYVPLYLTAADTREYGLRSILERSGLEIVDRRAGVLRDSLLPSAGLDRLLDRLATRRPYFLHLHTTNTHVPYRVEDPARFAKFDSKDDRGRYLNGLEEADDLLQRTWRGLQERGLIRDPILIITADHGQSFGTFGYRSHGSAVIGDEVLVPFALRAPGLGARRVPYSSHFDVLPTVLDLLGIPLPQPVFGQSLLAPRPPPALVLWAGRPSRSTTSNYGLVTEGRKWMVDAVLERVYEMGWDDEGARQLEGPEKTYIAGLLTQLFDQRGLR